MGSLRARAVVASEGMTLNASRRAFVLLGPQGVGVNSQSAPMPVDYANTIWPATITLSPWQAEVCCG